MAGGSGKVHVVRVSKTGYVDKQGRRRDYSSAYLRRTYRSEGKVKNETVANLSALPGHVIDLIDAGLKGQQLVPAGEAVTITRSLPHGHTAAVHAMAAKLGLPALLGSPGPRRDLAMALIISRVVRPGSKLSTLTWWADATLGADLGVDGASTDDIYAAMDWLAGQQDSIEAGLAARHMRPQANPSRMALFDLSSSWMEGRHCPLSARGYSRDGKKGKLQIEYGLLTDPEGRPVAVRVFPGNTGDPAAFTEIAEVVRKKFGLAQIIRQPLHQPACMHQVEPGRQLLGRDVMAQHLQPSAPRRFRLQEASLQIGRHHRPAWRNSPGKPQRYRPAARADLQTALARACAQPGQMLARARVQGCLQPGQPYPFHFPGVAVRVTHSGI